MIAITKGNPTPEEIAALVAVLALASGTTKRRITSSPAGQWRRSTPLDEVNPAALSRRGRRWQPSSAGWSRVGPGHRSQLPLQRHSGCEGAHEHCWSPAVCAT
jgi:hypothetical protein